MGFTSLLAGRLRQGSVFLLGTPGESAALFGAPPPLLPHGDVDGSGGERLAVETNPSLREAFARWLGNVAGGLLDPAKGLPTAGSAGDSAEREYAAALRATLAPIVAADRRQGLVNLFWLAHSREIADQVERRFSGPSEIVQARYRLHPLLSGILRRAEEASRAASGRPQRAILDFRRGGESSDAIIHAVIEDQFPLTEADPGAFDPSRVLAPGNRRFRIGAAAFVEIREVLRTRLMEAVDGGEGGVRDALRRSWPGELPRRSDPAPAWDRFIYCDPVREHLLHDLDGTAAQLLRSRTLRREVAAGRTWSGLLEDFAEVTRCLRRAEAIHLLRGALEFTTRGLDHQETRERYLEGRLYRFGFSEPVQSGVRTSTMLFADIRGFTRASEGPVSEGDLARELYEIFDPAALVVQRFGGAVDKYLGDGFMATFTGGTRPGEEALAAVRSAVVLQQVLGRLRRLGRTAFRMGISLHTGRVAVARFLLDDEQASTTVIGRQVNIAGRLSASGGDPAEAGRAPGARRVGDVAIDGAGNLVNQGIAVSGPLLEVLRRQIPCEPFVESGIEGVRWYDRDLCLWLHLGHVGEARFRGLDAAVPVYSLGFVGPDSSGEP